MAGKRQNTNLYGVERSLSIYLSRRWEGWQQWKEGDQLGRWYSFPRKRTAVLWTWMERMEMERSGYI